jgi:flagellar hook-basal body complex protein FliE
MNIAETAGRGNIVNLLTTNSLHFTGKEGTGETDAPVGSFTDMLKGAIQKVNDLQADSDDLSRKMVAQPDSVDIHQVMIAGQKAEISLSFAKAIRDEAIRTYRELMNLR